MIKDNTHFSSSSQGEGGLFLRIKVAGETLADFIARFREEKNISLSTPVTYAGRLDPMAEGLVVLLTGERCKEKDAFLGLPKTYEFQILFGIATDTFDMLGLVQEMHFGVPSEEEIKEAMENIKQIQSLPYPPFSSKPVQGKPLFHHAKVGTLPEVLPEQKGEIYNFSLIKMELLSFHKLIKESLRRIEKVSGDFRQEEIREQWNSLLEKEKDREVLVIKAGATVSSGVYIRSITVALGKALGLPALAYSINRIAIGEYKSVL